MPAEHCSGRMQQNLQLRLLCTKSAIPSFTLRLSVCVRGGGGGFLASCGVHGMHLQGTDVVDQRAVQSMPHGMLLGFIQSTFLRFSAEVCSVESVRVDVLLETDLLGSRSVF